ncbi:unnamed protein product, partial [Hapterophycus canaliculatus]
AGRSRCVDALAVVLNASCDGKGWFPSTRQLQLASLQLCVACRSVPSLRLEVDMTVPHRLWVDPSGQGACSPGHRLQTRPSRVPSARLHTVLWRMPASLLMWSSGVLADLKCLIFTDEFNDAVDEVVWPRGLRRLSFGRAFNQTVVGTSFPTSLIRLDFGGSFNQPIDTVPWPGSLEQLSFDGGLFNQPIEAVAWPQSLTNLTFGFAFNRPIKGVSWPPSLRQLEFGDFFNQPIDDVA